MDVNPKIMPEKKRREARAKKAEKKIHTRIVNEKPGTSKRSLHGKAQKMNKADVKVATHEPLPLPEWEAENARLRNALEKEARERKLMEEVLQKNEQISRELAETALRQAQELTLLDKVRSTLASKLDMPSLLCSVVESIVEVYG